MQSSNLHCTEKNPKHSPKKSYKPILGSILKVERVDRKFSENSTQAAGSTFSTVFKLSTGIHKSQNPKYSITKCYHLM